MTSRARPLRQPARPRLRRAFSRPPVSRRATNASPARRAPTLPRCAGPAVHKIAIRATLCIYSRMSVEFGSNSYCRAEGALSSSANAHHSRLKRECPVALRRGQTSALCVHCATALLAYGTRKLITKHERRLSHRSDAGAKLLETRSDPPSRLYHSEIGDTARLR